MIKLKLNEKEMRLLCGIVLDAADMARQQNHEMESHEMESCIEIVQLSKKIVNLTNEQYPARGTENDSIFGKE